MNELPPKAAQVLAHARRADREREPNLERSLAALHAALPFTADGAVDPRDPTNASGVQPASGAGVPASALATGKLALAVAVLGTLAGAWLYGTPARPKSARQVRAREPVVTAPPAPVHEPAPEPLPTSIDLPPPQRSTRPTELDLIDDALASLRRADAERAWRQLERHRKLYPNGAFALERRGLSVLALCAQDRREEGLRARAAFLADANASEAPIAARVRGACE